MLSLAAAEDMTLHQLNMVIWRRQSTCKSQRGMLKVDSAWCVASEKHCMACSKHPELGPLVSSRNRKAWALGADTGLLTVNYTFQYTGSNTEQQYCGA